MLKYNYNFEYKYLSTTIEAEVPPSNADQAIGL